MKGRTPTLHLLSTCSVPGAVPDPFYLSRSPDNNPFRELLLPHVQVRKPRLQKLSLEAFSARCAQLLERALLHWLSRLEAFFFFFRAALAAYGGSQARGLIGAVAASLRHSHSNARSLTHSPRSGIEPASSWILVSFVNHWAMMGTPTPRYLFKKKNICLKRDNKHS